jgi:hypothetical protein
MGIGELLQEQSFADMDAVALKSGVWRGAFVAGASEHQARKIPALSKRLGLLTL